MLLCAAVTAGYIRYTVVESMADTPTPHPRHAVLLDVCTVATIGRKGSEVRCEGPCEQTQLEAESGYHSPAGGVVLSGFC